ncbi:MAG: ABC transporter ATP-binding protein [Deltaproteobacteria bacterium]|nr:ABC transporter ATP-binding protein [Deltaproteobacteria bacterium]
MEQREPILVVEDVVKKFGEVAALDHCSFAVERGSITGLIGPNGAGKTTLFNLITGILRPDSGHVYFKGEDITGKKPYEIARKGVGRTYQIIRIFPQMTLMENLLVVGKGKESEIMRKALDLLSLVKLIDKKDENASELSFGQQKLLSLAQVLMLDAELILLDEPAAGINPTLQKELMSLIHDLNGEGKTFLIVEHDMGVIMGHCGRVIALNYGQKIAEGSCDEIQKNECLLEHYFGR